MTAKINLDERFGLFTEHWRPKVVAALNGQEVKIVKVMGEFPWHQHEHEDELFLVWKGNFRVVYAEGYAASFIPAPDPQLSVIARSMLTGTGISQRARAQRHRGK